jgi:hypothetical protein
MHKFSARENVLSHDELLNLDMGDEDLDVELSPLQESLDDSDVHEQIWGQLMGSPVSFPILCIVNYAVTRHVMERAYGKTITLLDEALKVNGDDVLFTLPPADYQLWCSNVSAAGLSPSIGKNYVSRRYAVINSTIFDCGELWDVGPLRPVKRLPILYMNLLKMDDISTSRRKDIDLFIGDSMRRGGDLESRLRSLIDGFHQPLRDELLTRAFRYARPVLDVLPAVSWFLPRCLGGLGLPRREKDKVSDLHLKIASMILCLDGDTRKDVIRLQWLKQPGHLFSEVTNDEISRVREAIGDKRVLSSVKKDEELFSPLIRSNLGLGVNTSALEAEDILKKWKAMYSRWVKSVQKIKWTDSHDHKVKGLHSMNMDKAVEYQGQVWSFEKDLRWV